MTCPPSTSTVYTTSLSTIYADVFSTFTTLERVTWAARTSANGQVYTPLRTVTVARYVEVTSVVQRIEAVRTVVGVCAPTAVRTPVEEVSRTTVQAPSSIAQPAQPPTSSDTARPTQASITITTILTTTIPSANVSHLASSLLSSSPAPTGVSTSSSLTAPQQSPSISASPSSPPAPTSSPSIFFTPAVQSQDPPLPASPSSPIHLDNTTGLFSTDQDILTSRPLSSGAVGGLAVGGLALFALIQLGIWYLQRRYGGSSSRKERDNGSVRSSWDGTRGGLGEKDDVDEPAHGKLDQFAASLLSQPSGPHGRKSAASTTPTNPYPFTTTPPISSTTSRCRHHLTSPTPAIIALSNNDRPSHSRIGSIWTRMSGFGWQMGLWGGDSLPRASSGFERMGMSKEKDVVSRHQQRSGAGTDLIMLDGPESGRMGRIPSLDDLRDFGRGMGVTQGKPGASIDNPSISIGTTREVSQGDLEDVLTTPARPSSEFTRGEDDTIVTASGVSLPLPPVGPSTLGTQSSPAWLPMKPAKGGSGSVSGVTGGTVGGEGRVIAGHKRVSTEIPLDLLPTDIHAPSTTTMLSPTTSAFKAKQAGPARPPTTPSIFPSTYSQPDHRLPTSSKSRDRDPNPPSKTHRPPDLRFAKEVGMPHLWMDEQGIAAFNPASTTVTRHPINLARPPPLSAFRQGQDRPASLCSAYDGMTEVEVTPLLRSSAREGNGVMPGEIFEYSGHLRSASVLSLGLSSGGIVVGKRPVVASSTLAKVREERGEIGVVKPWAQL